VNATAYVVDDAAMVAGFGAGTEVQSRELSRLIHDTLDGGPALHVPALCLAAAAAIRPAIADHIALLVTSAMNNAIDIRGLTAGQLAALVAEFPGLGNAATHAVSEAMASASIIITTDPSRYADVPVHASAL
jgi:hypothetical protein